MIKVKIVFTTLSPNNPSLELKKCHYFSVKNNSATDIILQMSSGKKTLAPGVEQIYQVPSGCVLQDTLTIQGIVTTADVTTMVEI